MSLLMDAIKMAMPNEPCDNSKNNEQCISFICIGDAKDNTLDVSALEDIWSKVYYKINRLFDKFHFDSADEAVQAILSQGDIYKVIESKDRQPTLAEVITMEEALRWFAVKAIENKVLPISLKVLSLDEDTNKSDCKFNVTVCAGYIQDKHNKFIESYPDNFTVDIK